MAEPVGALELKLSADIKQLEADLKKAEGRANTSGKRIARNMQGAFKGIGSIRVKLGLLAFGLAQIAALGGMKRLIDGSLEAADAIGKTSDKLGISNSALQELQFAAVQSGVSIETLNMGLQRFGRRAAEAAAGTGEARNALKQLKIELVDGQGALRSTEALFMDSMKALSDIENPLQRVRLGFKLFDSEGVALVNMAGNVGELRTQAQKLGIVLDDEVIAKSSETKDTLSALGKVTSAQLTPALVDLGGNALIAVGEQLAVVAFWANRMYRAFVDTANLGLSNSQLRLTEALREEAILLERIAVAENTRNRKSAVSNTSTLEKKQKEIADLRAQIVKLNNDRDAKQEENFASELAKRGEVETVEAAKRSANERMKIAEKAIEDLRKSQTDEIGNLAHAAGKKLQVFQNLSAEQIENEEKTSEAIRAIVTKLGQDITKVNKTTDEKAQKIAADKIEKIKNAEKEKASEVSELTEGVHQRFLEATKTEEELIRIRLKNELAEYKKMIDGKTFTLEKFHALERELQIVADKDINEIREASLRDEESLLKTREQAFEQSYGFIRDGFSDAMADMLIDGEFNFKALYQSFIREFVNRAIAAMAGSVFDNLAKTFSTVGNLANISSGVHGGGFNTVRSGNGSTQIPTGGIPGRANGGPVGGGSPVLIGEKGPELFIPGKSGFVATNQSLNKMGGGGGGGAVTVTVINNTGEQSTTTERDGPGGTKSIEVMVGKAISKNIARGGDVDQAIRSSYGVNRVGRHGV